MKADNRDVQRISNLARGYDRNLCGKDFLICYGEEGNARMLEVSRRHRYRAMPCQAVGAIQEGTRRDVDSARLGEFALAILPL